jgi:alkaline phosphatase
MPRVTALIVFLLSSCSVFAAERHAKNVILFIGDAGGIPTLHAASLYGHDRPQALFIHSLPHIALVETSTTDAWVSDSAAGMTAIVTGQKTRNGVLSQSGDAVRGKQDGENLKTLLEYAEERGLSTGVMSNMNIWDATPGACYAHANDRKSSGEIFAQILTPRFGDGVDIVIGKDLKGVRESTAKLGLSIERSLGEKGYTLFPAPADFPADATRAVALYDGNDFDPLPVLERVIRSLARNPKGYFLMVEWDMHTGKLVQGLERALVMDKLIRQTAGQVGDDTLILFAADHSSDLRVLGGKKGESLVSAANAVAGLPASAKASIRSDSAHTGEEILAAARGPGSERLRGFIANTDLFKIMMAAYGWAETGRSSSD